jgi:hypothetical protein
MGVDGLRERLGLSDLGSSEEVAFNLLRRTSGIRKIGVVCSPSRNNPDIGYEARGLRSRNLEHRADIVAGLALALPRIMLIARPP